jgi:SAM-dependent methyltransferase
MRNKPLWINLGCSDDIKPGYVNVDMRSFSAEDQERAVCLWADLRVIWPCADSAVDFILAKDIIEHLPDKIHTMNEAWRVLKPGGVMQIEVPTTEGRGAWQDFTHVSFWNRNSFFYVTDGDPHRERFGVDYGIKARFKVLKEETLRLPDEVIKLKIILEAVK